MSAVGWFVSLCGPGSAGSLSRVNLCSSSPAAHSAGRATAERRWMDCCLTVNGNVHHSVSPPPVMQFTSVCSFVSLSVTHA